VGGGHRSHYTDHDSGAGEHTGAVAGKDSVHELHVVGGSTAAPQYD
jgi:hypothetical protein